MSAIDSIICPSKPRWPLIQKNQTKNNNKKHTLEVVTVETHMPTSFHLASLSISFCYIHLLLCGRNYDRHMNDSIKTILVWESCYFEAAVKISILRNNEFHLKTSYAQFLAICALPPLLFLYGSCHYNSSMTNLSGPNPIFSHTSPQDVSIRPFISNKEVILKSYKQTFI